VQVLSDFIIKSCCSCWCCIML